MDKPYTNRAEKVLELAQTEAERLSHTYLDTSHLLIGLMEEGQGIGAIVLKNLGIGLSGVRSELERVIQAGEAEMDAKIAARGGVPPASHGS